MTSQSRARARILVGSVVAAAAVLATFAVIVTVRYRDGLEQRLRANLASGATALRFARTAAAQKSVLASLESEGISVDLAAAGGPRQPLHGSLMTIHEPVPVGGSDRAATLSASSASIDRQVRSLEITEAVGALIVLGLLAALARALVLLNRAVSEARASEAAMRTFLADAAHELRTPVAALRATAERFLREQPERPQRDAIEAQLARDSGRLGKLIDDLLNLARLDAREQQLHEQLDLVDLASAAMTAAQTTNPAGHIELLSTGPVPVSGDRDALLRVLRNLLDNAFAVADAVVLEVARAAGGAMLTVTDNGPGVPPDQRKRVFEPFVRLPNSPRGGTGLGLAIVRRTVESHGGTVMCHSSPLGGARFTIMLPSDT